MQLIAEIHAQIHPRVLHTAPQVYSCDKGCPKAKRITSAMSNAHCIGALHVAVLQLPLAASLHTKTFIAQLSNVQVCTQRHAFVSISCDCASNAYLLLV